MPDGEVSMLDDGSARSLADVLANPRHASLLAEEDFADLVALLGSIDFRTRPVEP